MYQLRVRTEYSFGETFAPIPRIIERLKQQGCKAAGIVDRASTWGHVAWTKACKEAGVQPLLGVEMPVAVLATEKPTWMWFIATTPESLSELYRVCSKAHQNAVQTQAGILPVIMYRDFQKMSNGIIKFAGECLDTEVLKENDCVIDYNPGSIIINIRKRAIAFTTKLRQVETSDNAFAFPEDAVQFGLISRSSKKPSKQWLLDAGEFSDGDGMSALCEKTAKAIAKASTTLAIRTAPMIRAEGDLEAICRAGIKRRGLTKKKWPKAYEERLQYELELIRSKNFDSYFIIVADMVDYAKQHMLVGPSRGSAAGSLVCYVTGITEIDPIPPGLYFERFIDVSRSDLPDIDLDFPDNKRHLVFEYMAKKYGDANVAHIGTISRYKPRSALIQACKSMNIPPQATAAVKVAMIERSLADSRANNCLEDTFDTTEPGREFIRMYPHARVSQTIEGHASHSGVHAAGLLVCNDDIMNYAVVDGNGIAHIEKGAAEELGLLKIDVLGLRTLGILEDAQVGIDWYSLKLDDSKTFDIFNRGRLCGIFQFEGNALRAISRDIKFRTINEIDAVTALARPGPFAGGVTDKYIKRSKGEEYQPIHPLVESHMSQTFGLPLYQEQTLAIVREIGRFDWKDTSFIRKAVSKRLGQEYFEGFYAKFLEGALSQGVEERQARETWELINAMGAWQMNKAHTYSYAVISYWTAYLKAHHPLEFAAATLRSAKDEESAIELLREMLREGYEYVPFDIEQSEKNWCVKDGKLLGGFLALKGFGEAKATKYIEARKAGQLTQKMRDDAAKAENVFGNIFPFQTQYGDMYDCPEMFNISGKLWRIADIESVPHREQRVFLGELVSKNARNVNEDVLIKKRGGTVETSQLEFVDVRLRDDTGTIGGRIGRKDYERIGRELIESVPIGSHLLVRASFFNGIRYAFIGKWKKLK